MVHHLPALLQLHVLDDEDGEGEGHVGPGENKQKQTELDLAEGDLALVLEDFSFRLLSSSRVKLMKTWLTRMRRKGTKKTMLKMNPPGKKP